MRHTLRDYGQFWRLLVRRFINNRGTSNAAALTYTTLFAVVPLMTVTFSVLSIIPAFQDTGEQIQLFIFQNFVPASGNTVQSYLSDFSQQARKLTWIGVGALAVTALLMLLTIEKTFNMIWRVRQRRRGMTSFLLYWAILSLGPLLLGAGFAMSTYFTSLSLLSGPHSLPGAAALLALMPLITSIAAFTLIYATVPNARVPFQHALAGGLFVAILLEVAKGLFALYVSLFPGYQLIYGAFATVPLFLLWVYLSWLIVLFGAELVCSLSFTRASRHRVLPKLLLLLGVLRVFLDHQQRGLAVGLRQLQTSGWPLSEDDWLAVLTFLEGQQLVCESGTSQWVLCRDLGYYRLQQLLDRSPWPLPSLAELPMQLNEEWYPPLRAALVELVQAQDRLFAGSVADWLQAPTNDQSDSYSGDAQGVTTDGSGH